jgi:hypothetical protein
MGVFGKTPKDASGARMPEGKPSPIAPAQAGKSLPALRTLLQVGRRTWIWQTRIATEAGGVVAIVTQTQGSV